MKIINFVTGGRTGDLIHELYVIKKKCIKENAVANLYLVDSSYNNKIYGCYDFIFNLNETVNHIKKLLKSEKHIIKIDILPRNFDEEIINLNLWRKAVDLNKPKSWTQLLNEYYNIFSDDQYQYLDNELIDERGKNKILIHHSKSRKNEFFNWSKILENDVLFLTNHISEYDSFFYKTEKIKPLVISSLDEYKSILKSCKLFIGNQSMPLALASALDVPRIAILYHLDAIFYMDEQSYSKNISWFLTDDNKYNSENVVIKI